MKAINLISMLFLVPPLLVAKTEQKKQPNFIVILADDMGLTDVGAFHKLYPGNTDAQLAHKFTPNLDKLAIQGIRCTRGYASPWSAPSRQMLLSGQWVNRRNAFDHPWMGAQLRKEGYVTGIVGKTHGDKTIDKIYRNLDTKTAEFDDGFFFNGGSRKSYLKAGEIFPTRKNLVHSKFVAKDSDYLTDIYTQYAIRFIEEHANQPFMLYLPFNAPHGPLDGKPEDLRKLFPEVFAGASDQDIMTGPLRALPWQDKNANTSRSDSIEAMHFAAMVYRMDLSIGRIIETLKKKGVDNNTIIIFTSDNTRTSGYGEWLSENHPYTGRKYDLFDGGIRVPYIVWSSEIASSKRSGSLYNGLVSLADIAPTMLGQATNKPNPYPTDGIDIMPYLLGKKKQPKGRVFFCALDANSEKMTGIQNFSGKKNTKIIHSVYIKDNEKILCWNTANTDEVGVSYARLPDVEFKNNAKELVRETPPTIGSKPEKKAAKALYNEFIQFVINQQDQLFTTWAGDDNEEDKNIKWWMIKK
jgi:arylsulfatase B